MWQDVINGVYESLGGFFILLSIIKLHKEKTVRGISFWHVSYFTSWGWWNLYYYQHIGQPVSFAGGIVLVIFNSIWLGQICVYSSRRWSVLQEPDVHPSEMDATSK